MAFTLAHPAAVLPIHKLPFMALLPLVIGSMTPDLIGFLPYSVEQHLPHSHSPVGTVLIDLPMGYLMLALLLMLRRAVTQPLWEPHRSVIAHCLQEFSTRPHRWLIAAPSLLVGSWTHIVWDRFTHEGRWTYNNLPVLYQPLFPDAAHQLPLFHFLQYFTSAIGLLYIGWQYFLAVKPFNGGAPAMINLRERRLHLLLGLMAVALIAGLMRMLIASNGFDSIYARLSLILKTALVCFSMLYLISGLVLARIDPQP